MALVSAIMATAGAVTSAAGAYSSAQGQKAALGASAAIGDINARQKEEDARFTLLGAEREKQAVMLRTAQTKSSQRAAMAANGVDLGSDSAVNILTSTDYAGEVDANTIEVEAMRAAWGQRTEATNLRSGANADRATAKAISPTTSAVNSLLGSAGQVSSAWYSADKSGALKKKKA